MTTVETPSKLFEEIAEFFSSAPSRQEVLEFKPSAAAIRRASELLDLNRQHRLDDALRRELEQYEQAELLMRLIKARIRAEQVDNDNKRTS